MPEVLELTPEEKVVIIRLSFPCLLIAVLGFLYLRWQYKKLRSLADRIRNDKYLIGTQLVNFYRNGTINS
jgi:membrane-anchored protein YejM (alkaline phosphatase superfamily)